MCTCLGSAQGSPLGQHCRKGSKACWCSRCFCRCDTANLSSLTTCATGQPANWQTGAAEVQTLRIYVSCRAAEVQKRFTYMPWTYRLPRLPLLQSWWWQLELATALCATARPAAWQGLLLLPPFRLGTLGADPAPRCHRGPLGVLSAAVSTRRVPTLPPLRLCSKHRSAGTGLFLTTSVAETADFGRGQGRELEGALVVGAFFDGGAVFARQSKTLCGSSMIYISSLVPGVRSSAVAL